MEINFSNDYVLFRWVHELLGEGSLDEEGQIVGDWPNVESNDTMYPATWLDKGISEWERIRCPWWLEYPLGHVPQCEETLWKGICFSPILQMSLY